MSEVNSQLRDSERKKKNIQKLEKNLNKESEMFKNKLNKKNLTKRQKEIKSILTNKPVSFFDPESTKKLQNDMEKMKEERDKEEKRIEKENAQKKLTSYQEQGAEDKQDKDLILKNLLSTVNKMMETTDQQY